MYLAQADEATSGLTRRSHSDLRGTRDIQVWSFSTGAHGRIRLDSGVEFDTPSNS